MSSPKRVHYLDILGLAINNLLKSVKMENCSGPGSKIQKSKIIGVTNQGEIIETDCIEYHRIVRTWIIIKHYEKWGKYMIIEDIGTKVANVDEEQGSEDKDAQG